MLAVTGLNPKLRIPNLNALRLGVGDWHDQQCDAERNQEQADKQQNLHIKSLSYCKMFAKSRCREQLVVQNDTKQRAVDLQPAFRTAGVIDTTQFPDTVHEKA